MQRASGWYRRNTVVWLAIVGFLLAVAFNIDTPRLILALASDPALRSAGYAAATEVVNAKDDPARQAIPLQLGFVRAAENNCNDKTCSEAQFTKLTALTLAKGQAGQLLAYFHMMNAGSDIQPYLKSYCGMTAESCSEEVKTALALPRAPGPAQDGDMTCSFDKDNKMCAGLAKALASDPRLFWYPGLAECMLTPTCFTNEPQLVAAVKIAREAAKASVGALDAYTSRLPGVGWIVTVYRQENWGCTGFFLHIPGWLLTALMTCIGAPFWFDLMQTIVNRRGAGPKPPEAQPVT